MLRPFVKRRIEDIDISRLQQTTAETFQSLATVPHLGGVYLSVDLIAGQDNVIAHKLGKNYQGIFPGLPSVQASVWADQTNNNEPSKYIYLQTSTSCTISLWIF